jgi:hypothetical protein
MCLRPSLSPAFFAKPWPQRELAGLAAREIDTGSKVILPVWHGVDRHYITQRSPVLADRLGAVTSAGIEHVADQVSVTLVRALTTANATPGGEWRGLRGGTSDSPFVGAYVVDQATGKRGQVEKVLGPRTALVRLEDGTLVRAGPDTLI